MKKRYTATIKYNTDALHPDIANGVDLEYSDVYTIDSDYFYGPEDIQDYIQHDLLLVAGGGYDHKHVTAVNINILEQSV